MQLLRISADGTLCKTGDGMELSQVAPELRSRVRWFPPIPIGSTFGRRMMRYLGSRARMAKIEGVRIETLDTNVPPLRLYYPELRQTNAALLWIHGGGYLIGTPAQDDLLAGETCRNLGMIVVSIDYRLAPEHPFPAATEDCLAAWNWLQHSAAALGIDPHRIIIGGESAGGGLAASLVQQLHDAGGIAAKAQWLFCPMIDDQTAARRELDMVRHRIWNNCLNTMAWRCYLSQEPGSNSVPAYAAPARRADLSGLPPAWIGAGDIELFYEENRTYAERLQQASVAVTLDIVQGAPHGFEAWAHDTKLAQDYIARAQSWLRGIIDSA
jgi:acetyl esterase/lipase